MRWYIGVLALFGNMITWAIFKLFGKYSCLAQHHFVADMFKRAVGYFIRTWSFSVWKSTNNISDFSGRKEYRFSMGRTIIVV